MTWVVTFSFKYIIYYIFKSERERACERAQEGEEQREKKKQIPC